MKKLIILAALALLPAGAAFAQAKKPSPPPQQGGGTTYEKKTVINFEDDTIAGDLTRPDGEYVEARRTVRHSNLIKIREDWKDKVMQAAGDM